MWTRDEETWKVQADYRQDRGRLQQRQHHRKGCSKHQDVGLAVVYSAMKKRGAPQFCVLAMVAPLSFECRELSFGCRASPQNSEHMHWVSYFEYVVRLEITLRLNGFVA